uniref:Putative DNA stabilization protein n=1 Tax=viral metagenome TaxID=1070528 RepID=A0A6M3IPY6_9ZZZZ
MGNIEIPWVGGAYTARSRNLNAQVCQNFYVETDQTGAKNIIALVGCPGMKLWTTPGVAREVRNFHLFQSNLYAVVGNTVYKITTGKVATSLGTIGTSTGWVDITDDGVYLCVFDSTGGWTSLNGAALVAISDADFPSVSGATYQDGYHIVSRAGTDQFFICDQDDPTSWDATEYATAEGAGDVLVSPVSSERQLWLIGTETTEIFYNSGATFPFERNPGGFLNIGCNAKRSIATIGNELLFLDHHNRIVRKQGLQLGSASTYQIDYLISTMSKTDDAVGFCYAQEGHIFYELSFPTDSKTICYDLTTGFWHTRASGAADLRSRANCGIRFDNKVLVGDYENGNIYEYDLGTYTDNGEVKRAIRSAQAIMNNRKVTFFNAFELEMETGVGDTTTDDPQIALQISKDGGHTWSTERWKSMGQAGEYTKRVRWNRLGKGREFAPKIIISDPVKRNISKAYLDGTVTND